MAAAVSSSRSPNAFGALLQRWRTARNLSQLELALAAGLSARHLSFLESGRADPSRDMLSRLAEALTIPLRERNSLLLAAGYAPIYRETGLTEPEVGLARRAIDLILRQHEPFPAIVIDRHWNLVLANTGAARLIDFLLGGMPAEPNVVRQIFRADLLRPFIANWDEVAGDMARRLHRELDWTPTDATLRRLVDDVLADQALPASWRAPEAPQSPVLTFVFRKDDIELRFFSTWTTFGSPHDVTLEELRIECSFPADEATALAWKKLPPASPAKNPVSAPPARSRSPARKPRQKPAGKR